jgi:DNA polymerase-2
MSINPFDLKFGYLFDIHHLKDKMILWVKDKKNDSVKRLEYPWHPSIHVASDLRSDLTRLIDNRYIESLINDSQFEYKNENSTTLDQFRNEVLKLTLKDSSNILTLGKYIEKLCIRFGHYRLYNVDVSPEQSFLYENEMYPLGSYALEQRFGESGGPSYHRIIKDNSEDVNSFDYVIPNFKFLSFDIISSERRSIAADFNDKISKITIWSFDKYNNPDERFSISESSEFETILEFCYEVNRIDPDIILTKGGDQFLFPHLFHRAKTNQIEIQLLVSLNRESNVEYLLKKNKYLMKEINDTDIAFANDSSSTSYISYGRVYFKPRPFYLYGRIHIDLNNCFIYKDNGLDGLAEISRVCRIPLQLASRSTIGKCLSSLYFYNAYKNDVLIPWKPSTSEIFKSFSDLLKADKGGTVFESKPGAYDKVAEYDFVSLYPNIMLKKNVSSDTINCECCDKEFDNTVPDLEHLYHLCKKRNGIVPLSLKLVLERRLEYKRRKNNCSGLLGENKEELRNCYDNRQTALKWILVTSFGYLGFSNSKFGRIDAHIAVCAFARDLLMKVSKIAENHGFEVIHGIVDSIGVREKENYKSNKIIPTTTHPEKKYENLQSDIEEKTGFSISFEGIYKWIVFDSSKSNPQLPALNRYFGVFEDGTVKMRGIETRRHDTPPLFVNFQEELMRVMSYCENVKEIKEKYLVLEEVHKKYVDLLNSGDVDYADLKFTKRISKNSNEYGDRKTIENGVIKKLFLNGKSLHAGEQIEYIITDFYSKNFLDRAMPIELINKHKFNYDVRRYVELLNQVYHSITKIFCLQSNSFDFV